MRLAPGREILTQQRRNFSTETVRTIYHVFLDTILSSLYILILTRTLSDENGTP